MCKNVSYLNVNDLYCLMSKSGLAMLKQLLKDPINDLKRGESDIDLSTDNVPLNCYLNRIGVKESAACPRCEYPSETVFDCRRLTDLRGGFLPRQPGTAVINLYIN